MGNKKQDADSKLQQGIDKHFKSKTVSFGGSDHKVADVDGAFQDNIDAWTKHEQAKLAAHDALAKAEASEQSIAPMRRALVAYIVAHFGATSTTLADFGLTPKKDRRKLNTDEKAVMVSKIRATRKARGTMGKRERDAIHGTVDTSAPAASVSSAPVVAPPVVAAPVVASATNGATNGAALLSLNGHS